MGVPLRQQVKIGLYVLGKRLRGIKRYPLVLMLEPLFQCNLACSGCGKIDYPQDILGKRLSYEDAMSSADECGAPVISIAGGEPLIHKELPRIVEGFIAKGKFVYLCTNALLLGKRMDDYQPSPYLTFSVHLDGLQNRHDASVCREGVFDKAVEVIREARRRGFRVTVNCTLFQQEPPEEVGQFMDLMTELDVEGVTIAPGFQYERAPSQEVFLQRKSSKQLFRDLFKLRKGRRWRFNHSSLYLDFLAGNQSYQCTAWGNPTRNIFGWQKPCYLLVGEGYAKTFDELMNDTDWSQYGVGNNAKCANCMVHCGFEPTAVNDAISNPLKAAWIALRGPRTDGEMAPEVPGVYGHDAPGVEVDLQAPAADADAQPQPESESANDRQVA